MTMELVTGHAGEPHVTAAQDAALHAGVIGGDDYVLSTKDRFAINVVSANKVTIAGGDLVMQGYHASNDKPADLIITNGSQGQKRNDIICCRYTKVGDSIESANLVVVKGTPTTGTPVDPTLNTTPISQGATTYDMALYRVPLDGITIGEPEPMFNILQPMSSGWDSLTQSGPTTLLNGGPGGDKKITGVRWGVMRMLTVSLGSKVTASWGKETLTTLPDEWRPKTDVITAMSGRDGQNQTNVALYTDGRVNYENQGGAQSNRGGVVSFCYMAAGQAG